MTPSALPLTYVLPIRVADGPDGDLTGYLEWLTTQVAEVIVVDGSAPDVFDRQHAAWGAMTQHVPVPQHRRTPMGKVGGVLTGIDLAACEHIVLADDDVRYDRPALEQVNTRLHAADVVVPQNYFDPQPWHAVYETARMLFHRALDGDYPGTLGLRRSTMHRCGGYAGDAMFENLELIRTVRANGGRVVWDRSLLVARRPPTTRHFLDQRVRQAYDELARPAHLLPSLLIIPALGAALARRRWAAVVSAAAIAAAIAQTGRLRGGGTERFPRTAALLAPLWVLERGCCVWLALGWRLRGGVPYAGTRLKRAATPQRKLGRSWEP